MEKPMIENAIAQFGILGIIVIGCGYGILYASRYIAKKCLEPLEIGRAHV